MEHALNALVSSYEQGKCNRRELLAALGALLAAGPPIEAAVASPQLPVKCRELNHVTLRVTDLARSRHFYSRVLGLPLMWEDTGVCALNLGRGFLTLRQSSDSGFDHWCVGVQGFTRARATADDRSREPLRDQLKREGFSLRQDGDDPTIYVVDPDGFARPSSEAHVARHRERPSEVIVEPEPDRNALPNGARGLDRREVPTPFNA